MVCVDYEHRYVLYLFKSLEWTELFTKASCASFYNYIKFLSFIKSQIKILWKCNGRDIFTKGLGGAVVGAAGGPISAVTGGIGNVLVGCALKPVPAS